MNNKKPLRCIALLCACSVLVLWASSENAHGFQVTTTDGGVAVRWPSASAGYYINSSGAPSASLMAIQSAMQTWTDVATSNFSFVYRGQTASTSYGNNDGANIISFGSLGTGYESTLALNTFWFTAQGQLLDSDIKFNDSFAWSTDSSATAYDVQTIAVHELGHSLSLHDLYGSGDVTKVMYYSLSAGQIKRSLTQDDKDGIAYLYSAGGPTTTSTTIITTTTTTTAPVSSGPCPAQYVLGQDHPDLEHLRAFRDGFLSRSAVGRRIIQLYYDHADSITVALDRSPALRAAALRFFEIAALLMADKK